MCYFRQGTLLNAYMFTEGCGIHIFVKSYCFYNLNQKDVNKYEWILFVDIHSCSRQTWLNILWVQYWLKFNHSSLYDDYRIQIKVKRNVFLSKKYSMAYEMSHLYHQQFEEIIHINHLRLSFVCLNTYSALKVLQL